jgi:hypothetical protein
MIRHEKEVLMKTLRAGLLIFLAGVLALGLYSAPQAAAAEQQQFFGERLDQIRMFRTTKADVIRLFGQPASTETIAGEEVLTYRTEIVDPVTQAKDCNVLTVTIDKRGFVSNFVYKRYCEV